MAKEGGTTKPSGLVLPRAGFLFVAKRRVLALAQRATCDKQM
jgi:hypothetical protein